MLKEFRAFVLRGNVVDLAVGIVIGAAFTAVVTAIVNGLINPVVSFAGTGDLAQKHFCFAGTIKGVHNACAHKFVYGQVFSALISFLIVAAVVFFLVVKPINRLNEYFKSEQPAEMVTRGCPECLSSIPAEARRCAFCTAEVSPSRA